MSGLTPSISPSTTGSGNTDCTRMDSINITLAANSSVSDDFNYTIYNADGNFQMCLGSSCGNFTEQTAQLKIWPGLHIRDVDLGTHVENSTVTRVVGQHVI